MSLTKRDYIYWHFRPVKGLVHQSNYPKISNVAATSLGLITWQSDRPATSQVQYGTTPLLGPITPFDGTLVTSHSVQLTGLTDGILYYFRVQSFFLDALSISDLYSFQFTATAQYLLAEDGSYILDENGNRIILE